MIQLFRPSEFIHHVNSLTTFSTFHHEKRIREYFFFPLSDAILTGKGTVLTKRFTENPSTPQL
jgi:hypothetical protein